MVGLRQSASPDQGPALFPYPHPGSGTLTPARDSHPRDYTRPHPSTPKGTQDHPRPPRNAPYQQGRDHPLGRGGATLVALTVCRVPGCPTLTPTGLCPTHTREADRKRGTTKQRGYSGTHARTRRSLAPQVQTGTMTCARCGKLILPGQAWDLGHSDDRQSFSGPEHASCNRATMGRERSH